MLSFGVKIAKIYPVAPEIICLREIIKKDFKLEMRGKASIANSPLGAAVSPPSK